MTKKSLTITATMASVVLALWGALGVAEAKTLPTGGEPITPRPAHLRSGGAGLAPKVKKHHHRATGGQGLLG